jgi:hypothetical protein
MCERTSDDSDLTREIWSSTPQEEDGPLKLASENSLVQFPSLLVFLPDSAAWPLKDAPSSEQ